MRDHLYTHIEVEHGGNKKLQQTADVIRFSMEDASCVQPASASILHTTNFKRLLPPPISPTHPSLAEGETH